MRTDLISKGELFNRLCNMQLPAEAICIINNMPTEEIKSGHWEDLGHGVRCSECLAVRESFYKGFRYCPDCGTFMGGEI